MPNENDERYEGTFETFSTQGYNAGDKFDLDVTWEGNLPPSSGKLLTRDKDIYGTGRNKEFEEPANIVDSVSNIRSVMSNGVAAYWIPSGYNGWEQSRMCKQTLKERR